MRVQSGCYLRTALSLAFVLIFVSQASANGATSQKRPPLCSERNSYACVAANFESLLELARNGDQSSANKLYTSTRGCNSAAIDAAGKMAASTRKDDAVLGLIEAERQGRLEQRAQRCSNFTAQQISGFAEIEKYAAFAGNSFAMHGRYIRLAGTVARFGASNPAVQNDVTTFVAWLNAQASAGNLTAIGILSQVYRQGLITAKDDEKAFTYLTAYSLFDSKGQVPAFITRQESQLGSALTHDQIAAAEAAASALVSQSAGGRP